MKTYELFFNEIDRISAVEKPAVESTLMAFSEEKPLMFSDDEKMIFYSVAMRPNKMIYRSNIYGEPANVFYGPETVVKMQQEYFRNTRNSVTNIEHREENVDGLFPFESWIVESTDSDKAIVMGLDAKKGDWVMGYKVDSPEIWAKVKSGEINGLSIESNKYNLNLINMNKQEEEATFFEKVKALFASQPEKEEEVKEAKDEIVEDVVEIKEDVAKVEEEDPEQLKKEIADLKEKVATLEAEKVKAETELVTMSKEAIAVTERIVNAPVEVAKPYEQMTNFEKLKFNRENR